jgi:hypothetical protein
LTPILNRETERYKNSKWYKFKVLIQIKDRVYEHQTEFPKTVKQSRDFDVLVHPNYTTTLKNYIIFKKYTVSVEGYGAKYENFRTERQKIILLENGKEIIVQD